MARAEPPTEKPAKRRAADPTPPPPPQSWDERLVDGVVARRREVGGVLLFLLALITLLALVGLTQTGWLGWWTRLLRQGFCWGALGVCMFLRAVGLRVAVGRVPPPFGLGAGRLAGPVLLIGTFLALHTPSGR